MEEAILYPNNTLIIDLRRPWWPLQKLLGGDILRSKQVILLAKLCGHKNRMEVAW